VITTAAVRARTVLLLTRFRFHLSLPVRDGTRELVAEDAGVLAWTGAGQARDWMGDDDVLALLEATPTGNTPEVLARQQAARAIAEATAADVVARLDAAHAERAQRLRDSHERARVAARGRGRVGALGTRDLEVRPQPPVDVLGVYVYLPTGVGAAGGAR
jgi:hypothetical protein